MVLNQHMVFILEHNLSNHPVHLNHDLCSGHLLVTPTCFLCLNYLVISSQGPYMGIPCDSREASSACPSGGAF